MNIELNNRVRLVIQNIIQSSKEYKDEDLQIKLEIEDNIKYCYFENKLIAKIHMNTKQYELYVDNKLTRLLKVELDIADYREGRE